MAAPRASSAVASRRRGGSLFASSAMTGVITDASSSARAEMSAWASRAVAGEADEQQLRQL
ncbi:hypothetical protein Ctob_006887, partial [Chrysochromulina tobinii]